MTRLRIRYAKTEALRYTSNLDVQRVWERMLRRARLPLTYSQGFHPQPKLNLACPLPLGITSQAEVIDVWLDEDCAPEDVFQRLHRTAAPGIDIQGIDCVAMEETSIQNRIVAARYQAQILVDLTPSELVARVKNFLEQPSILRERRGKIYD
ncbi:MAG: DUF2344 domain-containing protein, partial [Chloroflexi bacterium]|nr:DUF2344 domain-containing protein [Chloroflexota bacterium]